MVHIGNDWDDLLKDYFASEQYQTLRQFLVQEYRSHVIYPNMYDIFNALKYTAYRDVKVVILGQDPYHGPGQAHGLCFSVKQGVEPPPSLKNIFSELQKDVGIPAPKHGELTCWARQGVLLLNTVLTVREHQPNSHKGHGWEAFTDRVIELLDKKQTPIVFLLWGANARNKARIVTNPIHIKLEAPHPSPLSAYNGFFGCRHFSKANDWLVRTGQTPIDWRVE
ncbi:MAG: uracil-DNA glycosylase [Clostridia bacterium]|nr:uracil-DNA glycosylase [Clostridia bacterium]MBR3037153.1 uracil-DNA glycosylase [Clostridia bacterium]